MFKKLSSHKLYYHKQYIIHLLTNIKSLYHYLKINVFLYLIPNPAFFIISINLNHFHLQHKYQNLKMTAQI